MGKNILTQNEILMLQTYKNKPNNKIINYFFNKYKNEILEYLNYKILSKWSQSPLEKNNFISYIWLVVTKALNKINIIELKKQIKGIIFKISYDLVKREKWKLLTNGHKILNWAIPLNEITKNYWNNKFLADKQQTITTTKLDLNLFIEKFIKNNTTKKKLLYKKVIYLKSCGYSKKEIANKLKLKTHQIRYILDLIINEGKKYFKIKQLFKALLNFWYFYFQKL